MARPQLCGLDGDPTVDRDDLDAQRRERSVDLPGASGAQRSDDHLRIHARSSEQAVAALLGGLNQPTGRDVMGIVPIEEADQDIGVERYRSHSSRSRWR